MEVQQQFLNSKELAKAVALCHLAAELQGDKELYHKSGVLKNIFISKKFELPQEPVLTHALQLLIDFILDDNHRNYVEQILKVGKVMEPHDPFLTRFKRFLYLMDSYMAECLAGNYLSPSVCSPQENGILFSKNPVRKLNKNSRSK